MKGGRGFFSSKTKGGIKKNSLSSPPKQLNQPTWNLYLTDDEQFKLSNEELIRKKKQLISKHNILTSPSFHRKIKPRSTQPMVSSPQRTVDNETSQVTSLDMLDENDSADELSETSIVKPVHVSKRKKSFEKSKKNILKKTIPLVNHPAPSSNPTFNFQQKDMQEILVMITTLHNELRYYEQLSGKRSALDVDVCRPLFIQLSTIISLC
jgi:hypothetical protein